MTYSIIIPLKDYRGKNKLTINEKLEYKEELRYTICVMKGKNENLNGIEAATFGYNSALLLMTYMKKSHSIGIDLKWQK